MLLMIFVNDLWSLHDIPQWLEHTKAREDAMGLSDIIFPAFLFIVGLSIPLAIQNRVSKGDTKIKIFYHILKRSLALIVMGFFMVNHEYANLNNWVSWNARAVIMVLAFFLIWNHYEKNNVLGIIPVQWLQVCGIFLLLTLAATYQGTGTEHPGRMSPHWWGILGLIGWGYLLSSVICLLAGQKIWILAIFWLFLNALNAQEFYPFLKIHGFRLIISASNYALVLSGSLAVLIYLKLKTTDKNFLFPIILLIPAIISLIYGVAERPLWGISKILGTPSWTAICAGISFISFAVIYIVFDIFEHTKWTKWILPAGRNALTCYLLPTLVYALFYSQIRQLPIFLTGEWIGLIKSCIFAFVIISMTGILEKLNISIKL